MNISRKKIIILKELLNKPIKRLQITMHRKLENRVVHYLDRNILIIISIKAYVFYS